MHRSIIYSAFSISDKLSVLCKMLHNILWIKLKPD